MNLLIQNQVINRNANCILIQKNSFKGKFLTKKAFAAEDEIVKKINTLPQNIFLECVEFLKFCKSIDITPKISRALKKRLIEARQTNVNSKSFIA